MGWISGHMHEIFKNSPGAPPWARMVICGVSTGLPLWIGYAFGHLTYAIYAALFGYLVALNDHLGRLSHRILVGSLSLAMFFLCFSAGIALHGHSRVFTALVVLATYGLGLMGGCGAEMERMILFSIIQLLIGFYTHTLELDMLGPISIYSLIVYATAIASMWISSEIIKGLPYAGIRKSLASALTSDHVRHIYAFSFAFVTLLTLLFIDTFTVQRGYWTAITLVLIMKPGKKESLYRSFQRLTGTIVGVAFGDAVTIYFHEPAILILGIMFAAFFVPYAMIRNYWMVSFLVTIVVLLLLSLAYRGHNNMHLPWLRLWATVYGCGFSVLGVAVFRLLQGLMAPRPAD